MSKSKNTLSAVKKAARKKGLLKPKERVVNTEAFEGERPVRRKKTKTFNPEAESIIERMRKNRSTGGMSFAIKVGELAKTARNISGYRMLNGYGPTIPRGSYVTVVSEPYNPWGGGLVVDIMFGMDAYSQVDLKKLRPLPPFDDDEEDED